MATTEGAVEPYPGRCNRASAGSGGWNGGHAAQEKKIDGAGSVVEFTQGCQSNGGEQKRAIPPAPCVYCSLLFQAWRDGRGSCSPMGHGWGCRRSSSGGFTWLSAWRRSTWRFHSPAGQLEQARERREQQGDSDYETLETSGNGLPQ